MARARGVAALDHEALDHAMEDCVVVVLRERLGAARKHAGSSHRPSRPPFSVTAIDHSPASSAAPLPRTHTLETELDEVAARLGRLLGPELDLDLAKGRVEDDLRSTAATRTTSRRAARPRPGSLPTRSTKTNLALRWGLDDIDVGHEGRRRGARKWTGNPCDALPDLARARFERALHVQFGPGSPPSARTNRSCAWPRGSPDGDRHGRRADAARSARGTRTPTGTSRRRGAGGRAKRAQGSESMGLKRNTG